MKSRRMTLTAKIMIGVSIVTLIVLFSNIINYVMASRIEVASKMHDERVIALQNAYKLETYVEMLYGSQGEVILDYRDDNIKEYKEIVSKLLEYVALVEEASDTDEETQLVADLKKEVQAYVSLINEITSTHDDSRLSESERSFKYQAISRKAQQNKAKIVKVLEQIVASYEVEKNIDNQNLHHATKVLEIAQLISMGIVAIFSVLIGFSLSKIMTKNIKKLVQVANVFASGDLTHKIDINSNDEIGELANAFEKMGENLRKLVTEVVDISQHLLASSQELSATSEETSAGSKEVSETIAQIANGAGQQADSIEKTAGLMNEMNQRVLVVAESADHVNQSTKRTNDVAQNGMNLSVSAEEKINKVMTVFEKITEAISSLSALSQRIGSIADVINSISDQTNLLALNAAIEAARAGEQGKGFAVVADEIRKLAEQSSQSVQQVTQLTSEIEVETRKAVSIIESGNMDMKEGVNAVNTSGDAFVAIMKEFEAVANEIQDVIYAIKEIKVSSNNASEEIEGIAAIVEESAASSQEVAAISQQQSMAIDEVAKLAQQLAHIGEDLSKKVQNFTI